MRWPRFHRPRVDLDAIVEEYGQALLADAKMMGPVVYDPRMWVRVMLDEGPYEGGLTYDYVDGVLTGLEDAYRDALSGGREIGFPPKLEPPWWLHPALDKSRQDDAASGKLEP